VAIAMSENGGAESLIDSPGARDRSDSRFGVKRFSLVGDPTGSLRRPTLDQRRTTVWMALDAL
jgi:hypothetical protein